MNKRIRRFTYVTMLTALAIVINMMETLYIPPIQFGIRFGLANIIALITIRLFGIREMVIVNVMRVILSSLFRGTIFGTSFWIALGGITLSSITLIITKALNSSLKFASIISAIAHSVGQVLVVTYLYKNVNMFSYLPVLLFGSIVTGYLTGWLAELSLKRIKL